MLDRRSMVWVYYGIKSVGVWRLVEEFCNDEPNIIAVHGPRTLYIGICWTYLVYSNKFCYFDRAKVRTSDYVSLFDTYTCGV